jgi:hypothetical protein
MLRRWCSLLHNHLALPSFQFVKILPRAKSCENEPKRRTVRQKMRRGRSCKKAKVEHLGHSSKTSLKKETPPLRILTCFLSVSVLCQSGVFDFSNLTIKCFWVVSACWCSRVDMSLVVNFAPDQCQMPCCSFLSSLSSLNNDLWALIRIDWIASRLSLTLPFQQQHLCFLRPTSCSSCYRLLCIWCSSTSALPCSWRHNTRCSRIDVLNCSC